MSGGPVDTVVIDWRPGLLPEELAVSTITLAVLATGQARAIDPSERSRRQARLQVVEALSTPIDFGRAAARSFGLMVAAVHAFGRSHRRYLADLLIAAVAHAEGLTLYTRNGTDLTGLEELIAIVRSSGPALVGPHAWHQPVPAAPRMPAPTHDSASIGSICNVAVRSSRNPSRFG